MSTPLEERDLVNVRDADRSITEFLRDYPSYKERERLLYMQRWVRGMLARHELYVARYYLGQGRLDAALSRTEYALVHYQNTGLEPEALVLLGETYLKRHEPAEAAAAFQLVMDKFPSSPFTAPAKNFLALLNQTHPEAASSAARRGLQPLSGVEPAPEPASTESAP
jgi:outer membrane protein assembly factor BamD